MDCPRRTQPLPSCAVKLVDIFAKGRNFYFDVYRWNARAKEGNQMVSTLYSSNPATLVGFELGISCVFSCLCVFPFLFLVNPTLISIYVASKLKKRVWLEHIQIFTTFCWMFRIIHKHFYSRDIFTTVYLHCITIYYA